MSIEAAINVPFHRQPSFIDPRMVLSRAGTGSGVNRLGRTVLFPANTARQRFNPITGVGEGVLVERQATNLLLQSGALQTTWTATNLTVAGGALTAPDNTASGASLTASASGGNVSQAIAITAGRGIAISLFAKAFASNFLYVKVSDGSNYVECWFNLATGVVGSNAATMITGAYCVFSQKAIEAHPSGWYRCMLDVTTATSTAFTVTFGPAASDGAQPASSNSIYAWGAQAEAEISGAPAATSYIPTTTATVTRSADMLYLPIDSSWFNPSAGTLVLEFVNRQAPALASGSHVYGGVGNSFSDVIYVTRTGTGSIQAVFGSSLGGGALIGSTGNYAMTAGRVGKIAVAWATNDMALVCDGGTVSASTASFVVPTFARMAICCAPWVTSDAGNKPYAAARALKYFPRRLANASLQMLTSP